METTTFDLNMMYGDHHVIEVRKLISAIPGVEEIYASSCFQVLEVSFDESKLTENIETFVTHIKKMKPSSTKGSYIKRVSISATMSPGIAVDIS